MSKQVTKTRGILFVLCAVLILTGATKADELISFETSEGFTVGALDGQQGWVDLDVWYDFCFVTDVGTAAAKHGSNILRVKSAGGIESAVYNVPGTSEDYDTLSVWFAGGGSETNFETASVYANCDVGYSRTHVKISSAGTPQFSYLYWNGSANVVSSIADIPSAASYDKDGWNNLKYVYDFTGSSTTAHLYINDSEVASFEIEGGGSRITKTSLCNFDTGSQRDVDYDLVSFSVIPEPATMVLLACGGVFALLRRRRK